MPDLKRLFQRHLIPYWKTWVIILTPLLLLPLPIAVEGPEARAGYGVLMITIYWLTACLPLAVTSLLPIVVFPLMDVLSTSEVCASYFKEANVVFLGGLILALGVEQSKLHRRIALRVILIVGTNPRWLMLGFMLVGMLLSLWISNSGVTAMLIPIVEAVVDELFQESGSKESCDMESGISLTSLTVSNSSTTSVQEKERNSACDNSQLKDRIRTPMILSIAYSASIGGAGTLIGSGSPLAFKGILEELYGPETGLSFATWMAVGVPIALANTVLTWIWLQILFMGPCWSKDARHGLKSNQEIKASIRKQYQELGSATFYEKSIMALFTLLILLWLFKDPQFIPGWEDAFPYEHRIGDATVAIAILMLAFVIPAKPRFWCFATSDEENPRPSPSLLDWKYVQQKFPWNVLLLLGGGYVISDASKVSGLSYWLGHKLSVIQFLPPVVVCILMCLVATALTEVASNTATASILLPIVSQMGEASKINPLYLMIPVAISCCYAFMLPVGTPCNAQVISTGKKKLRPSDMVKAGAVMNIFTILVICAVMETIGMAVFDLQTYPDWADAP